MWEEREGEEIQSVVSDGDGWGVGRDSGRERQRKSLTDSLSGPLELSSSPRLSQSQTPANNVPVENPAAANRRSSGQVPVLRCREAADPRFRLLVDSVGGRFLDRLRPLSLRCHHSPAPL